MSTPLATSFGNLLNSLTTFLDENWAWPCPQSAFCEQVYRMGGLQSPVVAPAHFRWPNANELRNAPTLAACGYFLTDATLHSEEHEAVWTAELSHLLNRDPFPIDRQSFAFRPTELLGIVHGAVDGSSVSEQLRTRIASLVSELSQKGNQDDFSIGMYAIATGRLGLSWTKRIESSIESISTPLLALLKWCCIAMPGTESSISRHDEKAITQELLTRCALKPLLGEDIAQSALIHFSLTKCVTETIESEIGLTWPRNRNAQDASQIVENLCRRFHLFARQLQERRRDVPIPQSKERDLRPTIGMKDEYDVQDALFAILKLHFDDVRAEEWSPSYAGGQSRMDFILKREGIVVETKFVGPRLSQGDIVKQLTIDEKYYRQSEHCRTLICFVYDPALRCNNPAALENDVSGSDDDFRVVAIVSPKGL